MQIKSVKNQHFDAEMEMSDVDSMMTPGPSPSAKRSGKALSECWEGEENGEEQTAE